MKWDDCIGAYSSYISLGSNCQTSYQLRRLQLRKFAGPLDWFISRSVPHVTRLIQNRFQGFMDDNNLHVLGINSTNYIVKDNKYDVISYHDFPITHQWNEIYPTFKQTLNRRTDSLYSATKKGPVCFIRTDTSKAEAQKIYAALRSRLLGHFRLLIVNNNDHPEVRHDDWGLPHIGSVTVPAGMDWRGSNFAWDQIMGGFKLKSR